MGIAQAIGVTATSGSSPIFSPTSTGSASTLLVTVWHLATDVSSVTDDQSNTWVKANTNTHVWYQTWYCANATSGVTSVTINLSGAGASVAIFVEVDNCPASAFDACSTDKDFAAATVWTTNAATASTADTMGLCFMGVGNAVTSLTPDAGWTVASGTGIGSDGIMANPANGTAVGMEYQLYTSSGSKSGGGTNNVSGSGTAVIVLIKQNPQLMPRIVVPTVAVSMR